MSQGLTTLLTLLCVVLAGCGVSRLDRVFRGHDDVVAHGVCEVYRVSPVPADEGVGEVVHGHEVLDGPVPAPAAAARRLRQVLRAPTSYLQRPPAQVKLCRFEPTVMLRFDNGRERVDVLVSFICDRGKFYHNGKLLGLHDMDPAHNALLREVRALFPDDTYIELLEFHE